MTVRLLALSGEYAICRLAADQPIPSWASQGPLVSISRTDDELSILCAQDRLPDSVRAEKGWRAFRVVGQLDFSAIGILSALAAPLAAAEISILAISTFDTDYILVRREKWQQAVAALEAKGFGFVESHQA